MVETKPTGYPEPNPYGKLYEKEPMFPSQKLEYSWGFDLPEDTEIDWGKDHMVEMVNTFVLGYKKFFGNRYKKKQPQNPMSWRKKKR